MRDELRTMVSILGVLLAAELGHLLAVAVCR